MFQKINLINALFLIAVSFWMYTSSVNPSVIHLMPVVAGVILLALNNGIKDGSKEQKKVAFYITLFLIFCLFIPFFNYFESIEEDFVLYLSGMFILSLSSLILYVYEQKK